MRVHLYSPDPGPWDWRTADTTPRRHHAEMAARLARWGHAVQSFASLPDDHALFGPGGATWQPLAACNPAVPDVLIVYAQADPLPPVDGAVRLVFQASPNDPMPADWRSAAANLNAMLYAEAGGREVSDLRGHEYGHPRHFIYSHPGEAQSRREWLATDPGDVLLDIGSAVGSWTLPAAATGATVYAFDPGTDAGFLRRVVRENGFEGRVEVIGRLVADVSGRCVKRADIPWSSVPPEGTFGDTTTLAIDDFVVNRGLKRVDFVKVDTDGGELAVIAGMAGTLRRFRPKVVVEVHTFLGVLLAEVEAALDGLGYATTAVPLEDGWYFHVFGEPRDAP